MPSFKNFTSINAFHLQPFPNELIPLDAGTIGLNPQQGNVGSVAGIVDDVLQAGQTTEKELNITYKFPSGDQKPEEFNVVVIQECTPILYDEDGNAYADWDNVVTDSSNTQE